MSYQKTTNIEVRERAISRLSILVNSEKWPTVYQKIENGMVNTISNVPPWLDADTQLLVKDIINTLAKRHSNLLAVILYGSIARHEERPLDDPDTSDVDLLALLDSDDPHIVIREGAALFHSLGLAYNRHLDTPREVQVMFSSRNMQEWNIAFVQNVARDGIVLLARDTLPTPLTSVA